MNFDILKKSPLFFGMEQNEIESMLSCLDARQRCYKKDAVILHTGDIVQSMGLVLEGSVNIESFDFDGKKNILSHVVQGELFAETYASIPSEPLMVNVTAAEKCEILFLNAKRMFTICSNACQYHNKLIHNLLAVSAQKNLNLSRRIMHTSPHTIRERIESYLSFESQRTNCGGISSANKKSFVIPFDRQQLADYLNVDRSALSHELSKMQEEGIIEFDKNNFRIVNSSTLL